MIHTQLTYKTKVFKADIKHTEDGWEYQLEIKGVSVIYHGFEQDSISTDGSRFYAEPLISLDACKRAVNKILKIHKILEEV